MFRQLIEWNRRRKQWNADHVASWRGVSEHDEIGLSPFQRHAESELSRMLATSGYAIVERQIKGPDTARYITGAIAGTEFTFWIHDDTIGYDVGIESRRFEEWDYRTPDDLVQDFCHVLLAAL